MSNTIVFFDPLGRTIIGEQTSETHTHITVRNPAVLHAGLNNEGKIQVNLIPALFREFLKDWNDPIEFNYAKSTITSANVALVLEDKLLAQYNSMWVQRPSREEIRAKAPARELAPSTGEEPKKLDLFSEVKPE